MEIRGTIRPELSFSFQENASEVDGQFVLAKVKGQFFCPEGISRNNRYYSRNLWEKALGKSNVCEKLKTKTMYGTIGHKTPINDETVQEGKMSHIVTNLYIDEEGRGIGEALILNTPAGRNLNVLLRAGSEVFVSSRATGKFAGTKSGVPIVEEDSFDLSTFDFVLDAGFLSANPKLAEKLEMIEDEILEGDDEMDKKLIEENFELKSELKGATSKANSLEESLKALEEDKSVLLENNRILEERVKELEGIEEKLEEANETLAKYDEIGNGFEDIKEALEKSDTALKAFTEAFCPVNEIDATIEGVSKLRESHDAFTAIGTVKEITALIEKADEMIEAKIAEERQAEIAEMASTLKVKKEVVEKLLAKGFTNEEISTFVAEMKDEEEKEESDEESEDEKEMKESKEEVLEENTTETKPTGSRLSRIMEQY